MPKEKNTLKHSHGEKSMKILLLFMPTCRVFT